MKFNKTVLQIAALAALLASASSTNGQPPAAETVQVQVADFRGERPQSAVVAALAASRQDVVVVLVHGGSPEFIAEVEGNIKALVRNGYDRTAMILSGLPPGEKSPSIAIFSGGQTYAVIKDANVGAQTGADFYKLVRDAYEEDIMPKIRAKPSTLTDGGF